MSVYESVKFGLVEYTLFGLIEHKGVLVDSGHYTCRIFHNQCWYYCNDITIEKAVYQVLLRMCIYNSTIESSPTV